MGYNVGYCAKVKFLPGKLKTRRACGFSPLFGRVLCWEISLVHLCVSVLSASYPDRKLF